MKSVYKLLCVALSFFYFTMPSFVHSGSEETFEDIVEDANEIAEIESKKGTWVPIPIPVSNPTIGTGLQTVLLYLHQKKADDSKSPNATSGLVGMYTSTQSWLIGIFHDNSWSNDKYRFTGFLGYGEFNLEFYGIGDDPIFTNNPIDYELNGLAFMSQFQARIPKTEHWYGGVSYLLANTETLLRISQLDPIERDISAGIRTAGLGLLTTYDSRDDNYYPSKGQYFQAKWINYGETWGGEFHYDKLTSFINHYQSIKEKTVLAFRANLQASSGRVPFFDKPYLDMRGFARNRYRDQYTFSMHAEGRYKFKPRWGLVAFVESGWFGDSVNNMTDNPTIISYGGGIRWKVAKDKKLNIGIDVAFSTDDAGFHIRVGEIF